MDIPCVACQEVVKRKRGNAKYCDVHKEESRKRTWVKANAKRWKRMTSTNVIKSIISPSEMNTKFSGSNESSGLVDFHNQWGRKAFSDSFDFWGKCSDEKKERAMIEMANYNRQTTDPYKPGVLSM